MKIPDNCYLKSQSNDSLITCEENGRKFVLENKNKDLVNKILIDNCVIKGTQIRCDYLLEITSDPTLANRNSKSRKLAIYIELKGSDIKHAVEQLKNTIKLLTDNHKDYKKKSYVVSSRVPSSAVDIQKIKVAFMKDLNTTFDVKNKLVSINGN